VTTQIGGRDGHDLGGLLFACVVYGSLIAGERERRHQKA
jgi:hypothetical protein